MTAEKNSTAEAIRLKPHHKWSPNDAWLVFRRLNGINFAKGKTGKIAFALFFFAASVCFAGANPTVDSLKAEVGVLSAKQNEIKSSIDSISVKATEKAHHFYKDSFAEIQNSYSDFLFKLSIAVGILTLLTMVLLGMNFYSGWNSKKEIKEEIKTQSENQKTDFENLKKEINKELSKIKDFENKLNAIKTEAKEDIKNQKINLKLTSDDIFKEIRDVYFSFALNYLFDKKSELDISMHFMNLGKYFGICTMYNIELNNDKIFLNYEYIESFIDKDYEKIPHSYFLYCFEEFKQYCYKNNNEKHIEYVEKIWKKLCNKFGEQNILDEIKKYKERILYDKLDIYVNGGV